MGIYQANVDFNADGLQIRKGYTVEDDSDLYVRFPSNFTEIGPYASAGGASVTNDVLKAWVQAEAYELTAITRDADEVPTTATAKWPDGSGGTFTTTTKNSTFLVIDAFTISHTLSAKTVTQAAVTRDTAGAVTVKPALTVA